MTKQSMGIFLFVLFLLFSPVTFAHGSSHSKCEGLRSGDYGYEDCRKRKRQREMNNYRLCTLDPDCLAKRQTGEYLMMGAVGLLLLVLGSCILLCIWSISDEWKESEKPVNKDTDDVD